MKKPDLNIYVLRKVVKAKSLAEAIALEKKFPVVEAVLVIEVGDSKKQLMPAIGFQPREPKEIYD